MNELIKINNQDLTVKEFKGQRVITFEDIDTLHERSEGTAKRNFYDNRYKADGKTEKFIKGIDYFQLTFEEVRSTNFVPRPNSQGLILITENGYLMLVKSLQDDLAWEVQRQLVNNYFRRQIITQNQSEVISEIKSELQSEIHDLVQKGIDEVKETCSQYYRPASVEKYNISSYIKRRLEIDRANEEYELVKQRVLIILGAEKWEDVDVETLRNSLNVIDESIDAIKGGRRTEQISLFENKNLASYFTSSEKN